MLAETKEAKKPELVRRFRLQVSVHFLAAGAAAVDGDGGVLCRLDASLAGRFNLAL